MKKLVKTALMLGAVCALAACDSVKWQTVTLQDFLDVADDMEEVIKIKSVDVKNRFTYCETYEENVSTVFVDKAEYKIVADIDVKGLQAHYSIKKSESSVYASSDNTDSSSEFTDEQYISYNEDKGLIVQSTAKKEYMVLLSKAYLDANATEDYTSEQMCYEVITDFSDEILHSYFYVGSLFTFFIDNFYVDDAFHPNSKFDVKYQTADGGCYKGIGKVTGSYDDNKEGEYQVDFTCNTKAELRDYRLAYSLYDYEENGKYYLTATDLVDYKFVDKYEVKTSKFNSFNVPSIEGYSEVTSK